MRVYLPINVFDAALARIRWLFDEFPNIVVSFSGGKDSTVVFNLTLRVAREKGRLPLTVMFLDQEAEWEATVEQVRLVMTDPDVNPMWLQIPFRLFNATSTEEHWLHCWAPEDEARWMRPREPYAITENVYGTDRFHGMFGALFAHHFKGQKACYLAGVRTEESPARYVGLTHSPTYKWATWGTRLARNEQHFTMYPIYDWSYTDVWAAIHKHRWPYNRLYDAQFAYGLPVKSMRVTNVHHETAIESLFYLQEVEPATYERLTQRIKGIDTAGKFNYGDYFVKSLPPMFRDWPEYRDFLLEKLIDRPEWRETMRRKFATMDRIYAPAFGAERIARLHIASILTNDWELIKLGNFERSPQGYDVRKRYNKALKARAEAGCSTT